MSNQSVLKLWISVISSGFNNNIPVNIFLRFALRESGIFELIDLIETATKWNTVVEWYLTITSLTEMFEKRNPNQTVSISIFIHSFSSCNAFPLLICTWFLKNQVRQTRCLGSNNQFWNWFLQATQHTHYILSYSYVVAHLKRRAVYARWMARRKAVQNGAPPHISCLEHTALINLLSYTGSKNSLLNRLKIKFAKLAFSKLIF